MTRRTLKELEEAVATGLPGDARLLAELRSDARLGAQALYQRCLRRNALARARHARMEAMLSFERTARANGFRCVAGVDEAGRGPLAGPIVAAAVVLDCPIEGLNDSKQLTAGQRDALFTTLQAGEHDIGVAVIEAAEIDRIGLQTANYRVMAQAVVELDAPPDFLLVDGRTAIPGLRAPQQHLVRGDSRSLSIAAASIVAKVTRDRMMAALDHEYPEYGFAKHKGYGTREHVRAIARYGPCPIHRRSFAPVARSTETGLLF